MRPETPLERLEDALRAAGCRGARGLWTCPGHEDRSPSLSVREADDGRVLLHCHAGCETRTVLAGLRFNMRALFPDEPPPAGWTPRPRAPRGLAWAPPPEYRGRMGLPAHEDTFWGRPAAELDAHFAAADAEDAAEATRVRLDPDVGELLQLLMDGALACDLECCRAVRAKAADLAHAIITGTPA